MAVTVDDVTMTHRGRTAPALRALSLHIDPGERVALVGPSGAGKSTLLRLLTRSLVADAGRVAVDGQVLAGLSPVALRSLRACIGVVHQRGDLVPQLDVRTNVAAGAVGALGALGRIRLSLRHPDPALSVRVSAALAAVGLVHLAGAPLGTLSGGERQRAAVARLIVQGPRLVLADEPTASVDTATAGVVLDAIDALGAAGATVVVATHDPAVAARFDRVIALRDGRVDEHAAAPTWT